MMDGVGLDIHKRSDCFARIYCHRGPKDSLDVKAKAVLVCPILHESVNKIIVKQFCFFFFFQDGIESATGSSQVFNCREVRIPNTFSLK